MNDMTGPHPTDDQPLTGCGPMLESAEASATPLRRQLFDAVRAGGNIARVDIARTLSISPATVTSLSSDLIAAGLIGESELTRRDGDGKRGDSGRGRPPVSLCVRGEAGYVIGIKISDKANSAVVLDLAGRMIGTASLPAPSGLRTPAAIVDETESLVVAALENAALSRDKLTAVAVGLPGMLDFEAGQVIWCPFLTERDVALRDALGAKLRCPVRIDNDANLLTLAELWFGAGRHLDNFVVVSIEHGVGMGMVTDHALRRGGMGHGMELGHTKVQMDGALCRCGRRGCLEAYVADYALKREATTALALPHSVPDYRDVQGDVLETLYARAKAGDGAAEAIFGRAGRYLAMGLANIITLFDPALILLSGERLRYDYLYAEEVLNEMRGLTAEQGRPPTPVEIHAWGDLIWAQGAAALALDHATDMLLG